MYGCQQVLIKTSSELKAYLEYVCSEAKKLSNCGIYYSRQLFFKTGKLPSRADLHKELGTISKNPHYHSLYSDTAQQILTSVAESFKSYKTLLKAYRQGKIENRPKLPKYLKGRSGLAVATFTGRSIKLRGKNKGFEHLKGIRLPLGQKVKAWFGVSEFYIPFPSNLSIDDIREVRILPRNNCFYAEYVYKLKDSLLTLDDSKALGIDPGVSNWLTCVSNFGTSFIIDGKHLKSVNQWYNKCVSKYKKGKSQGFWSNKLAAITEKRNRQMRDAVNKAARIVINYCIDNNVGQIVFGWNKYFKVNSKLNKIINQNFVQIPTSRLKERIKQLCQQYGIKFTQTEESYTSQSSFINDDFIPTFGEDNKPKGWKPSGKRIKRGLYKTDCGFICNSDCNGAANILRKVATTLNLQLSEVSRGSLSNPCRVLFWTKAKSPVL